MINIPGRIPITIHPLFWLTALLIGFLSSQGSPLAILLWIVVILVSVLVHEFGHALMALAFHLKPSIELVALGGVTTHEGKDLPLWKQFLIVLNGPLFGFLLFLSAWGLGKLPLGETLSTVFLFFSRVNLIWTILNLVPVVPLDGGQLLRIVLEALFGKKGFRYSLIVGMGLSLALSVLFFLSQNFLPGALFFLFAFQSFDIYRRVRRMTEEDHSALLKQAFEQAELDLKEGNKESALAAFERIHKQTHEGMLHFLSAEYLAFLKYEKGETLEAYKLLQSIRRRLSREALCLLHKVAFDQKDYQLVAEIGGTCFQVMQVKEVALRTAFACAALKEEKSTVGWLEAAFQEGLEDISSILKESYFDPVRESPLFKQFEKMHAGSQASE